MKINKKFAVENFEFFYKKLTDEMVDFEKIISEKIGFILASQLTKGDRGIREKEKETYNRVCMLYCRLINEYQFLAAAYEGKIPRRLRFKIENAYAAGEMIQRYQSIDQTIDDMNDPYGEDEV